MVNLLSYSGNLSSFPLRVVFEHAHAPAEMVTTGLPCTPGHVPCIVIDTKSYALEASQEFPSLLSCFLSIRCSKSCWLTQTGKHTFGFLNFSPLPLAKCNKKWRAEQRPQLFSAASGKRRVPTTDRHVMG